MPHLRKSFVGVTLLVLLGVGCSSTTPMSVPAPQSLAPQAAAPAPQDAGAFNPTDVRIGDQVAGMAVTKVSQATDLKSPATSDDYDVQFQGTAVISGSYDYAFSDFDGSMVLAFTPDDASAAKLPHAHGKRASTFLLTGRTDPAALGLSGKGEKKGTATIEIKAYHIAYAPAEVNDSAEIARAIAK